MLLLLRGIRDDISQRRREEIRRMGIKTKGAAAMANMSVMAQIELKPKMRRLWLVALKNAREENL